jgi:hypothetical protein
VRLIEPEAGRVLRYLATEPGEVTALAASDWRFVAAAVRLADVDELARTRVYVWDAVLGSEFIRWDLGEDVSDLAFVPSNQGGQPSGLVLAGERLRVFPLPSPDSGKY